ncbi:MAG: hypothetical protein ACKVWR_12960 [Acidimicrobiales bacterium]
MPTYHVCVKLTASAQADIVKHEGGYARNLRHAIREWEKQGGKVLSYLFGTAAGEWDIVCIGELPSGAAAHGYAAHVLASGGVERSSIQEVFSAEEADAAIAATRAALAR